jgi:hypothetical protein
MDTLVPVHEQRVAIRIDEVGRTEGKDKDRKESG